MKYDVVVLGAGLAGLSAARDLVHGGAEFRPCCPDEVADRGLAMIDGLGIRTLLGDSSVSLERAR